MAHAWFTEHARARMQQRGIRSDALEPLLAFGSERHLRGQGCDIVFFDKKAKKRLAKAGPAAAREAGKFIRTYASSAPTAVWSPSATATAASGNPEIPLDFLVALLPFIAMLVLWVLED